MAIDDRIGAPPRGGEKRGAVGRTMHTQNIGDLDQRYMDIVNDMQLMYATCTKKSPQFHQIMIGPIGGPRSPPQVLEPE